jgi:hypothetical protein
MRRPRFVPFIMALLIFALAAPARAQLSGWIPSGVPNIMVRAGCTPEAGGTFYWNFLFGNFATHSVSFNYRFTDQPSQQYLSHTLTGASANSNGGRMGLAWMSKVPCSTGLGPLVVF